VTRGGTRTTTSSQDGVAKSEASKRLVGYLLVILATVCWSTSGLFITSLARDDGVPPMSLAFWRVLVTSLCLIAFLAVTQPRQLRVHLRDLPWLAGMGALAVGSFQVLWIAAVLTNGPSVATILQCNSPIIVTLLARIIWREALTWQKWAAIGLASLGTLLIAWPADTGGMQITVAGFAISIGSAMSYAGITLFTKRLAGSYSSWTILAYAFGFAALALLPFQLGHPLPKVNDGLVVVTFASFVLITTIGGYACYTSALRRLPASITSIMAMSEVPFAALIGYLLLGDRLSVLQVLGALVVLCGVALLSLRAKRATQPLLGPLKS
jgi:drug/metabolite transporter (DMT)-like permease